MYNFMIKTNKNFLKFKLVSEGNKDITIYYNQSKTQSAVTLWTI